MCPPRLVAMCRGLCSAFVGGRSEIGYGSSGDDQKGCVSGSASVMKDLQHQYGLPGEL